MTFKNSPLTNILTTKIHLSINKSLPTSTTNNKKGPVENYLSVLERRKNYYLSET